MAFFVYLDDAQGYFLASLEDFLGMIHALFAKLRNVDQTLQISRKIKLGESTKIGQAGNFTFHQLTNLEVSDVFVPRVTLELANGETNAATVLIDGNNLHFDFIANL